MYICKGRGRRRSWALSVIASGFLLGFVLYERKKENFKKTNKKHTYIWKHRLNISWNRSSSTEQSMLCVIIFKHIQWVFSFIANAIHLVQKCTKIQRDNLRQKALKFLISSKINRQTEAGMCSVCRLMWIHCWFFLFFEWGTVVTHTQEDTLFPSFSVNNRLSLFILLPSPVPPLQLSLSALSVSGSVPHNIRGSPVICDPSNPHLILLKRGSIQFTAWRAPNRPSLLWQVSTLANNWSPVPCPIPQCSAEPKLCGALWKKPHNREWGGEERRGRTRERLHSQTAISRDEAFLNKQKRRRSILC